MMKKLLLTAFAAMLGLSASADLLLTDNFDYQIGNLYLQGNWVRLSTNADEPIQVADGALSYSGYQNNPGGKSVILSGGTADKPQRLQKGFADDGITSGTLYYSLLVNPRSVSGESKYAFAGFSGKNFNGWGDAVGNTSIYGVASITPTSEGKFKFGLGTSTAVPTLASAEYDINQTYLIIVSYDFGSKDVKMWINPSSSDDAAAITLAGKGTVSTTNGLQGICLWQGASVAAQANIKVDALKVATQLSDLFTEPGSTDPNPPTHGDEYPSLILSQTNVDMGAMLVGSQPTTAQVDVQITASEKQEDLILSSTNPCFSVSPAVISYADACNGASFMITYSAASNGYDDGRIVIGTESYQDVASVSVSGAGIEPQHPMNYAFVSNDIYNGASDAYYCIESATGTVTYIDEQNNCFYIQDLVGALKVNYMFLSKPDIQVGSKISKFFAYIDIDGELQLYGDIDASWISQGTPKTATAYRLADVQQSPESYWNKLIAIEDVTFADAGGQFSDSAILVTDDAGKQIGVKPFAASNLIGTTIPTAGSVTGIMVAKDGKEISPRWIGDVTGAEAGEASLTVSQQKIFDGVAAEINTDTEFAKFTFVAENMTGASEIYLTGTDAAMFCLDRDQIPAGSGTYVVTLTYHPTKVGKHKANVMIEANPNEFSCMYQVNAAAYDPANPPVITVPESVEQLVAAPGEQAQAQFTISSANMFDYGIVSVAEQSTPGAFIINNASLYPNIDASFTVTFKPLQAGDYTATIKVSAPLAEDKYISLSGHSEGSVPEPDKEGTELRLDKTNPLTLLTESFDAVEHNKPLMLTGWDNVAVKGLRAWWGYTFTDDGNSAAKVTAYDSKADTETPCEMLLVTPALDFKNAEHKVFNFSVMGDFLPEEGTNDVLEVLYIEDADYMQVLDGMNIPNQADYNKQWIDYVMDLTDYDLADTFFIGFRLKSQRGRNNSTVYYIDNVLWGHKNESSVNNLSTDQDTLTVVNMQGIVLLRNATKADLHRLPRGLYIVNGKKSLLR